MQKTFSTLAVAFALLAVQTTRAELTLPSVLGSHMVLQRGQAVPIWGWASAGEKISVTFAGQTQSATASADGSWKVSLAPLQTSITPSDLVIEGAEKITLTDVLVGEVWFCSGQSNMEKPIGEKKGQKPTFNAEQELASGDNFPLLRLYRAMDHVATNAPQRTVKGDWSGCSSNALATKDFSAAGYFFGREIFLALSNVPIGLVESAWGGTRIEPWTPRMGFAAVPSLAALADYKIPERKIAATNPVALFNGMVAPIAPFAMRGALWYQGESNCMGTEDGMAYADKMRALIGGWRKVWAQGDFPFYFVQIAPFRYFNDPKTPRVKSPDALPEFWEAQSASLAIKNTGMIVTTDITDDVKDIHPRNKLDVGKRLALVALAKTYGRNVEFSGPVFRKMETRGGKIILSFDHATGLRAQDGQPLNWFTLAGADGIFGTAKAEISGEQIIVSSPDVRRPLAARFAWHELATPNLVNGAGLPCAPFRTDKQRR
jgi:sialate O-acetylesterase